MTFSSFKALVAAIFISGSVSAQVTFRADAPLAAAAGQTLRVEFSLTGAEPDADSFTPPDFAGFDAVAGPSISQGHSVQVVDGAVTQNTLYTVSYTLLPQSKGNHTIGAAHIRAGGKRYSSAPIEIEISDHAAASTAPSAPSRKASAAAIGPQDLLLRLNVSRQSVYKGEPLLAVFKLYRRVPVAGFEEVKFPSLNGFWTQELDVRRDGQQRETIDGKVYETTVVREYLLYPQQSGALFIEPASLTAVAQVVSSAPRTNDPFDAGPEVYLVRRKLTTPRLRIDVRELPAGAPAGFAGAVGRFSLEASLNAPTLAANSAGTYTVRISGTGNLPFVQAPKLSLPDTFELYNVKTTESLETTSSGVSGYRQFDYPFIARTDGEFRLDSTLFVYFNPAHKQYVTLTSPALPLSITPDRGASDSVLYARHLTREEVEELGRDIRFIHLPTPRLKPAGKAFFGSALYWVLLGGVLALFATAYWALRRQIRLSQNAVLRRGRRASKVATARFHTARAHMLAGEQAAFYEAMLSALWGYMSDRFNIPLSALTKENVREELLRRGARADDAGLFTEIVACCEQAQYSPAASARMSDLYRDGMELIARIESIKR